MDRLPKRPVEQYYADIRAVLDKYYQPGDSLTLFGRYWEESGCKCEMCGGKVTIHDCYVLRNNRSKQEINCGCECITKYAIVVEQMGLKPVIECQPDLKKAAARINSERENTVTILPALAGDDSAEDKFEEDEFDEEREDLMGMGLDPDDPDFTDLAPHGMSGDETDDDDDDDENDDD